MPTTNNPTYQKAWRVKNPDYAHNYNKSYSLEIPIKNETAQQRQRRINMEKEQKDKISHRAVFLDTEGADEGIL